MEKELNQIRNSLNDKMGEDQLVNSKNKEKNAVLFSEVVRLGKEFEGLSEGMTGALAALNQKVQVLESRAEKIAAESNASANTGNDFTEMLVRYTERSETRFTQLESSFALLLVIFQLIEIGRDEECKGE